MSLSEELGVSNASNTDGLGDLPAVTTTISPQEECLKTRKWYCFLLSSIFTFLAGLFIILIWRAFAFLCCSRKRKASAAGKAAQAKAAAQAAQEAAGGQGASQRKAPGEGATEIGLMTEAKDWAGGLISGQTTTGRILVVLVFLLSIASLIIYFIDASRTGASKTPTNARCPSSLTI
ncbi:calcium-activated potassium channel slowpoke-like isoform X3 [Varroa destructor]|uniref:Calcium-activated potassium channel slowpoke n=1 Tax=Varroa destructor TaxID=109461 RepID=A0A7M7L1Y5_VARDE|nr:calcium-activated potassium channel slowpoke-like isoform X3 [Varroa destructor]